MLNPLGVSPNSVLPDDWHSSFTVWTTGYLILFAPHTFAPQRQYRASEPPSPLVFLRISTNFTSTLGIPLTSLELKTSSFGGSSRVEPWDFTPNFLIRLRALYAQ